MEIFVGENAGFCPGVKNAVDKAENVIKQNGKVYCLGELVHNKQVVDDLTKKGMITVNEIEEIPDGEKVIFRAHGEAKSVYERAKQKKLEIIDLTCGKVKSIHSKVEKEKENSFIIIIGKKNHPEVIGTKGFSGENSFIIETEDDILDSYIKFEKTALSNVFVVGQTTISSSLFDKITKKIEKEFIKADCFFDKTICNATEKRQAETKKLSKDFHKMIIIGGKKSSNTQELVKIAEQNCEKVYNIETADELKREDFLEVENICIMAGASTPQKSIEDVKRKLENI